MENTDISIIYSNIYEVVMKYFYGNFVSEVYENLYHELLRNGESVGNTLELTNCIMQIRRPTTKQVYFPYRKISENYANAELKWYWSADNSVKTISKHAALWSKISDDGKTSNSAYGYIIKSKYGYDQIQKVIELLTNDPNSRRAVINISDPLLDKSKTKDFQCTVCIQFMIRNHGLEMTVYMRSNDIYFGFPYDFIYFVSLGEYISSKLNVPLLLYTHHAGSIHMYKKDMEKFKPCYQITKLDVEKIIKENYDETYKKRD